MTPLEALIRERVRSRGPVSVAEYMALCLGHPDHGYYMTRDPFGVRGDFTTAPEISQMFGELVGAWLAQVWLDQGAPTPFVLAELGPGRGTLMMDVLRVLARVPDCLAGARICCVETSPVLRAAQREVLADHDVRWCGSVSELPQGPLVVMANEFFDALPVRQFQRVDMLWRERLVGTGEDGLAFVWGRPVADAVLDARFGPVADGTLVEVNAAGEAVAGALAARIASGGGAAVIVDYGSWDGTGDTLQALRGHRGHDPLNSPGEADLTAHVRFRALAEAAEAVRVRGPMPQGGFLDRLGIGHRANALAQGKDAQMRKELTAAYRRLTHPEEMGNLYQVLALTEKTAPVPPGFDG